MKKIVYISDFFSDEVAGGAEIYDSVLINELKKQGVKVVNFKCSEFTIKHLNLYLKTDFYFIISNFIQLRRNVAVRLQAYSDRYVIIEHDHKYLSSRDPSKYFDFIAPKDQVVNRPFYAAAKAVFCQSVKHAEVLEKNLQIKNVVNLECSLWSDEQLDLIQSAISDKQPKCFILDDKNPIKGLNAAIDYCEKNNLNYDVVPKQAYSEFLKSLATYETLVFFPQTLESFCRLVAEARMLGCKLKTNNLNGCTYEPWFKKYKGQELIDYVRAKKDKIVDTVFTKLFAKSKSVEEDITVILNCYRRPYNLKMQVDAIRAQSIKPKQIWLWINYHEDNKDFDPASLGIDRVFKNDFNWKFYGRFAAALLADTKYIAIYDDDTIPGSNWHKNCLETMDSHEGILGSAGVTLNSEKYIDHQRCGWPTKNEKVERVDLVGHAWFFKRDWLQYLWKEKPPTWHNGEDIQFAYSAQKYGAIQTYCPPHPAEDQTLHGSILGNELGIDNKATSTNSAVSHQQFFTERDMCVQYAIANGWQTVKGV